MSIQISSTRSEIEMKSSQKTALKPDFQLNGKPYIPKEGDEIVFTNIARIKPLGCYDTAYIPLKNGSTVCLRVDGQEIRSRWLTQKLKEGWFPSVCRAILETYGLDTSISEARSWTTWISRPPDPAVVHNHRHHSTTTYRLKKPERT